MTHNNSKHDAKHNERRNDRLCNRKGICPLDPYTRMGLNGRGQIIGIADTGLDTTSCYFTTPTPGEKPLTKDGTVQVSQRKVIQYVPYADSMDDEAGHGTHTCGILTRLPGKENNSHEEDGMIATDSKISFFDLGKVGTPYLLLPSEIEEVFTPAYESGARLHSNSWGSTGNIYSELSRQVDDYLQKKPDTLVIFPVGNQGLSGTFTVGNPGTSKNAMIVGSYTASNDLTDAPIDPAVSYFSSIGPTYDGRIKPDILAPGHNIVSARASSVHDQATAATAAKASTLGVCSQLEHEKSGTSTSVPSVAGAALLMRQYFMDPTQYASSCNKVRKNNTDAI